MQCPICKQELEIKSKKVGETESGEAIFNEFAICHDCKKKWNLDKHRAKKQASVSEETPKPKKKRPDSSRVKPAPRAMDEPIKEFSDALGQPKEDRPKAKKRKAIDNTQKEQTYSNIPPKHIRESREKEMRENYQNMLDEGAEDEESGFPTVLIVILILVFLAAAAFAGYWFLLR